MGLFCSSPEIISPNLLYVKILVTHYTSEAQGPNREAGSEGSGTQTCEPMDKNRITRRERRTSRQKMTKSISIKGAKRKSGGCARKAGELTPGDLTGVRKGLRALREALTAGQKSAEGVVGHVSRQG